MFRRRFERGKSPMSNSVNTNVGAMVALQSLNRTNEDMAVVQKRISTACASRTPRMTGRPSRSPSASAATWRA
jgi:hypothetical protein